MVRAARAAALRRDLRAGRVPAERLRAELRHGRGDAGGDLGPARAGRARPTPSTSTGWSARASPRRPRRAAAAGARPPSCSAARRCRAPRSRSATRTGGALPERRVGRIFVRGPGLMRGYFGRPEETAAVLSPDGWLDTGDLGYRLGGEIVVTGRAKDLIIVNGRNVWPQDLEWSVEQSVPGLRSGDVAAFSVDEDDPRREAVVRAGGDARRARRAGARSARRARSPARCAPGTGSRARWCWCRRAPAADLLGQAQPRAGARALPAGRLRADRRRGAVTRRSAAAAGRGDRRQRLPRPPRRSGAGAGRVAVAASGAALPGAAAAGGGAPPVEIVLGDLATRPRCGGWWRARARWCTSPGSPRRGGRPSSSPSTATAARASPRRSPRRRRRGARCVLVSSLAAREPRLSPYAASKRAGEEAATAALDAGGVPWTVLRPCVIYGPWDREGLALVRLARAPVAPVPRKPEPRIAMVHAADVAASRRRAVPRRLPPPAAAARASR